MGIFITFTKICLTLKRFAPRFEYVKIQIPLRTQNPPVFLYEMGSYVRNGLCTK